MGFVRTRLGDVNVIGGAVMIVRDHVGAIAFMRPQAAGDHRCRSHALQRQSDCQQEHQGEASETEHGKSLNDPATARQAGAMLAAVCSVAQMPDGTLCPTAQTRRHSDPKLAQMYVTSIQALLPPAAGLGGASDLDAARDRRTTGSATDTSWLDSQDLIEHLDRCRRSRGSLFHALCLADTVDRFLAPRVVTILVVVALLVGAAFAVL